MTDRAKLEEAIRAAFSARSHVPLDCTRIVGEEALKVLIAAAEAHLATLPKTKDHVVICRRRSTGRVELFSYEGESLMTAEDAAERVKNWTKNYHDTAYVAVKIPA